MCTSQEIKLQLNMTKLELLPITPINKLQYFRCKIAEFVCFTSYTSLANCRLTILHEPRWGTALLKIWAVYSAPQETSGEEWGACLEGERQSPGDNELLKCLVT